ncbi:MAG TPA: ImmA/IrrE family metallo-endopeptidase [Ohtaekwangia sp.]|nr:ImmA/IrrE family metallo-endopeptidase [Ohtaekwangia sp.]
MVLNPSVYRKIEKQVSDLLKDEGIQSLPIPVEKIARTKGVEVMPYDLGNEVSGVLVITDKKGTIGFNPTQSKVRQRFTIAHELGHYLLHSESNKELFVDKDFIVKFRSKKNYSPTEQRHESEANAFAAALLMPKTFVLAEIAKQKFQSLSESELIEELAKVFDVSVPAMTYRLSDLSIGR